MPVSQVVRERVRAEFIKRRDAGSKLTMPDMQEFMARTMPNEPIPSTTAFYAMVKDLRGGGDGSSTPRKTIAKPKAKRKTKSERVTERLAELVGEDRVEDVCGCVKNCVDRGLLSLDGSDPLEQIVCDNQECLLNCKQADGSPFEITVRLRDFIFQADQGGDQYEDMQSSTAPIACPNPQCDMKYFLAGLCSGNPKIDDGKFHNHCTDCPRFGKCAGDYRDAHCYGCNKHYFAGSGGQFECHRCNRNDQGDDCVIS